MLLVLVNKTHVTIRKHGSLHIHFFSSSELHYKPFSDGVVLIALVKSVDL